MEEKFVEVPDESAKTDIRRVVDMEPLLVEWLRYYARRKGTMNGPIDRSMAAGCAEANLRI